MSGPITGGTIAGIVIITMITVACLIWFVAFWLDGYDRAFAWWGPAVALIAWIVWFVAMYPLAYDYHHWVRVDGQIGKIGKRLISNGDNGISQRYVVTINGQPYGVDDTRASLLKEGDTIHLACKREFEWGVPREANGWACRWRGSASG